MNQKLYVDLPFLDNSSWRYWPALWMSGQNYICTEFLCM